MEAAMRTRRRAWWRAGVAGVAILAVSGAAADTLNDALVSAYLSNPDLEAARAELRATDELVAQALAGYRPQVFIDGELRSLRGTQQVAGSNAEVDTDTDTKGVALSFRQNLYAGGGTQAQVSRAENLVRAGRAGLVATEQAVLLDAVRAYTAAWRDLAVLDLALNNERVLRRQLQQTQDQFAVGEVARTDVAQAEARLSRGRSDVEVAKADLAASNAEFRRVIGRDPEKLAVPMRLTDLPASLAEAQALAEANPAVVRATYQLFAARDDVDVAFANILPSLDLRGDAGYTDSPRAGIDWDRSASLGVVLSIPLYQGGAEYAAVRQNRQTAQQRRSQLESANRSVQATVASAWDRLLAASAAVRAFRDEVRANEIAYEGVNAEQQVGLRTVIDVLDAQQDLFTSQVNLVRAQAIEVESSYALRAAAGSLTVVDLGLPVEPYQPGVYYDRNRDRLFGIDDGG
jgi:TolC family type I secretion outer membrane protein